MVEFESHKLGVAGSIPASATNLKEFYAAKRRTRLNRFIPKPERVVVARKALAGHPSEDPEGVE